MNDFMDLNNTANRRYIERLRTDPRIRAIADAWTHQACIEAEGRYPDPRDAHKRSYFAAERALQLALTFILDNDGEYRAALEQIDRLLKQLSEQRIITIPTPLTRPSQEQQG